MDNLAERGEKDMAKADMTDQQKLFAQYYHETGNATQSAIMAGYSKDSASSQGSRLLNNVKVKKFIDFLRQEEGIQFDMDLEMAIEELVLIIQDRKVKPHYRLEAIDKLSMLKGWKKAETKIEINNNVSDVDKISDDELSRRMEELMNVEMKDTDKLN